MIEQLSKTKVWAEFVEWMKDKEDYEYDYGYKFYEFMGCDSAGEIRRYISDRELLSLSVEFCDSKGYYLIPVISLQLRWAFIISKEESMYSNPYASGKTFGTRTEATQQAVVKCFELMSNN